MKQQLSLQISDLSRSRPDEKATATSDKIILSSPSRELAARTRPMIFMWLSIKISDKEINNS